jgi:hypothetical protein
MMFGFYAQNKMANCEGEFWCENMQKMVKKKTIQMKGIMLMKEAKNIQKCSQIFLIFC